MKFRSLILVIIIVCLVLVAARKKKNGKKHGGHGRNEKGKGAHEKGKGAHEKGDGCDQEEKGSTISEYDWDVVDWERPERYGEGQGYPVGPQIWYSSSLEDDLEYNVYEDWYLDSHRDDFETWDWELEEKGYTISDDDYYWDLVDLDAHGGFYDGYSAWESWDAQEETWDSAIWNWEDDWDSDSPKGDLEAWDSEAWNWDEEYMEFTGEKWDSQAYWDSYSLWIDSMLLEASDSTFGYDQDWESYPKENWDWDIVESFPVAVTGLEEIPEEVNISFGDLIPVQYDALKTLVEGETNLLLELLDGEIDWAHLIGEESTLTALISDWQELGKDWNTIVAAAVDNKDELIQFVQIHLSQRNYLESIIQQIADVYTIFEKTEYLVEGKGKLDIDVAAPASISTDLAYDSKHEETYDHVDPMPSRSHDETADMTFPKVTSRSTATVLVDLEDLLKLMSVNTDVMPRQEIYTLQNLKVNNAGRI